MLVSKKSIPAFGHIRKDGPGIVPHARIPAPQLSGSPGTEGQPGLHGDLSPKEKSQTKIEKKGKERGVRGTGGHQGASTGVSAPICPAPGSSVLGTRNSLAKNLRESAHLCSRALASSQFPKTLLQL